MNHTALPSQQKSRPQHMKVSPIGSSALWPSARQRGGAGERCARCLTRDSHPVRTLPGRLPGRGGGWHCARSHCPQLPPQGRWGQACQEAACASGHCCLQSRDRGRLSAGIGSGSQFHPPVPISGAYGAALLALESVRGPSCFHGFGLAGRNTPPGQVANIIAFCSGRERCCWRSMTHPVPGKRWWASPMRW